MNTKHTPGPWCVWESQQGHGPTVIQGAAPDYSKPFRGYSIATPYLVAGQQMANARLIAAAPELLEACKAMAEILSRYPSRDPNGEIWGNMVPEIAKAAIQKAEGTV